ncbi:aldo/keto reductase family protein [Ceratobasidium sp. AG-Ba]|nr:aldo/keto reductase family protein [Ceratobasidium sp. AG-Ba]
MLLQAYPTRKIGADRVSAIGFGAMGIGGFAYGSAGDDESRFRVLDKLVELGCTNWDTADIYGDSEELIGKWFKRTGKRDQIFLASKFGVTPGGMRGDPEYVKASIERSLNLLGVGTIDLYYVHRIDPTVPIEITMHALVDLVKVGKIRYIGLSAPSPNTLRRAHKIHPIAAIQVEYSPFVMEIEEKGHLLETARELGVAVVAYSPIGKGLLSGQITCHADLPDNDFRRIFPKYSDANFPTILALGKKLKELGSAHNATAGQVALAFLLAQGDDIIPIPGTKNIKYVEENVKAAYIKLSQEEVDSIRRAINETELPGERYPPQFQKLQYQDTPEFAG